MSRLQKVAVWNVSIMLLTMMSVYVMVMFVPKIQIAMMPMALMSVLCLGNRFFKGNRMPDWDEMERQISSRSTLIGYWIFWVAIILGSTFYPFYRGYSGSMPVEYMGYFPLFAAYLLLISVSLATMYQASSAGSFKKLACLIAAAVILCVPPVLVANALGSFAVVTFAGSQEKDEWHFNSSKDIIAHSSFMLEHCPEKTKLYISLPYANGVIKKAAFDGAEVEFKSMGIGEYYMDLPYSGRAAAGKTIDVTWEFPVANLTLEYAGDGKIPYRTRVRSLIPVRKMWLTAVLDDGCGYEVVGKPGAKEFAGVWNCGSYSGDAVTNFGSCGLGVQKVTDKGPANE